MNLIPGNAFTVVLNPSKETFNFPSSAVSSELPSILCFFFFPIRFMRSNQFYFSFLQFQVQFITIIRFISNQSLGLCFDEFGINSFLNKFAFMCVCSKGPYGERKTRSVCDCHDLCPFAFFSFSNMKPPFLALAKVPSIKHSVISIFPRSFRSLANDHKTLSHVPERTHVCR